MCLRHSGGPRPHSRKEEVGGHPVPHQASQPPCPTPSHILLGHCLSHPTRHHEQLSIWLQVAKGATSAASLRSFSKHLELRAGPGTSSARRPGGQGTVVPSSLRPHPLLQTSRTLLVSGGPGILPASAHLVLLTPHKADNMGTALSR